MQIQDFGVFTLKKLTVKWSSFVVIPLPPPEHTTSEVIFKTAYYILKTSSQIRNK